MSCNSGNSSGDSKNGLHEEISISGAFALYPLTVKWAEEFQKLHPGVHIDISAGGAGKGLADALAKVVDLGMFSRGITDEEKAKGTWWIAVAKDAVLPTINAKNPVLDEIKKQGVTRQQFIDIYITQKIRTWGELVKSSNNKPINVFTRSDACGAAEMWGKYLQANQESLMGTGVLGDPGIADAVKNDINSIGYNNVIYAYDINTQKVYPGIEVIPIDINENGKIDEEENIYNNLSSVIQAIKDNRFPSPPARDLYFVSNGKPQKEVVTKFLEWIITEGQQYVAESGYVSLSEETLDAEMKKLQ